MGFVAGLIALVCSIITIAVAWIFFRPVLGIILLVIAGALLGLLIKKLVAAKAAKAA